MESLITRKTGGQPGNQNACKHGLYSKVLHGDEKRHWKPASGVIGIEDEITILRVKLRSLIAQDGASLSLINQTVKTLGWLYEIQSGHGRDSSQLKEAVKAVLEEFIIPGPPAPVSDTESSPELKTKS